MFPLTVVKDNFKGKNSKFEWLAFNLEPNEIPSEISGPDYMNFIFWDNYDENTDIVIGKGHSVEEAIYNLSNKIGNRKLNELAEYKNFKGKQDSVCKELNEMKKFL